MGVNCPIATMPLGIEPNGMNDPPIIIRGNTTTDVRTLAPRELLASIWITKNRARSDAPANEVQSKAPGKIDSGRSKVR